MLLDGSFEFAFHRGQSLKITSESYIQGEWISTHYIGIKHRQIPLILNSQPNPPTLPSIRLLLILILRFIAIHQTDNVRVDIHRDCPLGGRPELIGLEVLR